MSDSTTFTTRNETWNVESRFRLPSGKRVRTLPVTRDDKGRFEGAHNYKTEGTFGQVAKSRR